MVIPKSPKNRKIVIALALIVLAIFAWIYIATDLVHEIARDKQVHREVTSPSPTPGVYTSPPQIELPPAAVDYSLVVGETEIIASTLDFPKPNIVFWQGYAFVPHSDRQNENIKVVKYNLQNGEQSTALEIPDTQLRPSSYISVSSISVVGDKLVVILSAYMEQSEVYWFSSPTSEPQLLPNHPDAFKMEKLDENYFLVGGFGDGCGGWKNYELVNPQNLNTTFVIRSDSGCSEGMQVIGNYNGYFITSEHVGTTEKSPEIQTYTNLLLVSMINPSLSQNLLSNMQMPKDVFKVTYDEDNKRIHLEGDDLYSYDLVNGRLELLGIIPDIFKDNPVSILDDSYLCVTGYVPNEKGIGMPVYYKIARTDGSYIEDRKSCEPVLENSQPTANEKAEELIEYLKNIKMPDAVQLFIEENRIVL